MSLAKINVDKWLVDNESSFAPPVCNQLMHGNQLKVMFVGGPNVRKDFHLEEGEELFYQIKGDMVLRVLEQEGFRDIPIRAGEMFLLPGRTYHSPQRKADTIGLVMERRRGPNEMDCLRYFTENRHSVEALWERWFYCEDLVVNLPPLIKQYFQSEAHTTGKPGADTFVDHPSFTANVVQSLGNPINFAKWLEAHKSQLQEQGPQLLWPKYDQTAVLVYCGRGGKLSGIHNAEMFVWNLHGTATLKTSNQVVDLLPGDCVKLPEGESAELHCNSSDTYGVTIQMPTPVGPPA